MDESLSSPKTAVEYRAVLDDLLRQIDRMNEQMALNQVEIQRLRAEAEASGARTDAIGVQIDARLDAIEALL